MPVEILPPDVGVVPVIDQYRKEQLLPVIIDPLEVKVPDDNVLATPHEPRIDNGPLMPAQAVKAPASVPPASGRAAFALSYADLTAVAEAATLEEVVEVLSVIQFAFGNAAAAKSYADLTAVALAASVDEVVEVKSVIQSCRPVAER